VDPLNLSAGEAVLDVQEETYQCLCEPDGLVRCRRPVDGCRVDDVLMDELSVTTTQRVRGHLVIGIVGRRHWPIVSHELRCSSRPVAIPQGRLQLILRTP